MGLVCYFVSQNNCSRLSLTLYYQSLPIQDFQGHFLIVPCGSCSSLSLRNFPVFLSLSPPSVFSMTGRLGSFHRPPSWPQTWSLKADMLELDGAAMTEEGQDGELRGSSKQLCGIPNYWFRMDVTLSLSLFWHVYLYPSLSTNRGWGHHWWATYTEGN